MPTSQDDLRDWFKAGRKKKATHMIVVVDTFDHEDYPVYVKKSEDARKKVAEYSNKDMQRVMEVYNLSMDMEKQIKEQRSFNY